MICILCYYSKRKKEEIERVVCSSLQGRGKSFFYLKIKPNTPSYQIYQKEEQSNNDYYCFYCD